MTASFRPSGEQFELRAGRTSAVVTEVGGGLRSLRVGDRDLVAGYPADRMCPVSRGAVLAPWPNRIRDGRYRWDGAELQLPLTEPGRGNALHGLVSWLPWTPVFRAEDAVGLGCRVWPQPGYPFQLDLTVTYRVGDDGLVWRLDARNSGATAAPYGCAVHPYVLGGPGRVDDWSLTLPVDRYLEVDPERLLPVGLRPVEGSGFDFRSAAPLGGVDVDHAFTGVRPDPDGVARAVVRSADTAGVVVEWDPAVLPWVQVHTAGRPEPELDRAGLAVEPMTCPPDAFRSGDGLVRLEPGQSHSAWWRIALA